MPDHYLTKYKKDFGRPCPRIELHSTNEEASQIVMLALNQYTQPVLSAYILTMGRTGAMSREAMKRAVTVLSSKELDDMIKVLSKRESAKRQAESKAVRRPRKR